VTPRFICSVAARDRDEPLFATASTVRRWLLVEVHGAWGHDAVADSQLGSHAPAVWRAAMRRQGIRVIAIRRDLGDGPADTGAGIRLVHMRSGRPGEQVPVAQRIVVADLRHVVEATESIVGGGDPDGRWERDDSAYVLVCTNGRHDSCCATEGRPLMRHLRTSRWSESVWECSHIGGDRFAGNIVLLPLGLYFGRCTPADADALLSSMEDRRIDLTKFRGRSTFSLLEQAAEHFVRAARGLEGMDAVLAARTVDKGIIELDLAGDTTVRVVVGRRAMAAPTPLTCKGRDGQSYPEYDLRDLTDV